MDMRARRALPTAMLTAVLTAVLLLLMGGYAVPARAAGPDPELIAESVAEDGYYVDSGAPYLHSDADLDRLRAALERSGRAGVVVLPAGAAAEPVLSALLRSPNRKATYVVLAGARLQATSNELSRSDVDKLVAEAGKAGDPTARVLTFLNRLGAIRHGTSAAGRSAHKSRGRAGAASADGGQDDSGTGGTAVSGTTTDSGGNGAFYAAGGVALVVAAAAAGGILLLRRRKAGSAASPDSSDDGAAPAA